MKILTLLFLLCATACPAAMQFNGSNSELITRRNINGPPPLTLVNNISQTISVWLKRRDTNSAYFLSFGITALVEGSYSLRFNSSRTNCVEFTYEDDVTDATHVFSSEPNIGSTTNVWIHIGFTHTFSQPATAVWWVNGVQKTGGWTTGTGATTSPITVSGAIRLGCDCQESSFFNGEIGDVALYYNVLLKAREMQLLSGRIKGLPLQIRAAAVDGLGGIGPCVYWSLDQMPSMIAVPAGTTNIFDLSHYQHQIIYAPTPIGMLAPKNTVIAKAEQVCSYPPNE